MTSPVSPPAAGTAPAGATASGGIGRTSPTVPPGPGETALIAQLCQATSVTWLRPVADPRSHLAWQVWHDGALHVVAGAGEQTLPSLEGDVEVVVSAKGAGSRTVTYLARGTAVAPGTEAWERAVDALAAKRLNAVESHAEAGAQRSRWASRCVVTRLDLAFLAAEGPAAPGAGGPRGEETARDHSQLTLQRRPWHAGGRPQRIRPLA